MRRGDARRAAWLEPIVLPEARSSREPEPAEFTARRSIAFATVPVTAFFVLVELASNEEYFIDTLHFSPAGHRYLAELLSRELIARKLL